jgi:hypothetical protein
MQTSLTERDTQPMVRPQPVFVDPSGRRRRIVRHVTLAVAGLAGCYMLVFLAAMLGAPIPPSGLLPVPDAPARQQFPGPAQPEAGGGAPPGGPASAVPTSARVAATGNAQPATGGPAANVTVTPSVTPALERPNSNANPVPPGLTRHLDTRTRKNGE